MFDPDGQDLLLLQPGKGPVQNARFAPTVHPRVDGMPVAHMTGQAAPFATVLNHIKKSVEQLQIGHADIAALSREAISDTLILALGEFHHPNLIILSPFVN